MVVNDWGYESDSSIFSTVIGVDRRQKKSTCLVSNFPASELSSLGLVPPATTSSRKLYLSQTSQTTSQGENIALDAEMAVSSFLTIGAGFCSTATAGVAGFKGCSDFACLTGGQQHSGSEVCGN